MYPVNQRSLCQVTGSEDQYPLVNIQKTIEHGHRNSEFSHQKL